MKQSFRISSFSPGVLCPHLKNYVLIDSRLQWKNKLYAKVIRLSLGGIESIPICFETHLEC